jgi:hypothetical protein
MTQRTTSLLLALALALSPSLALAQTSDMQLAQVRGVLLDAEGLPAEGYQLGVKGEAGDLFLSPATAQDGSFVVQALPPGRYTMVAYAPDGTEYPVLGRAVELSPGQVERVELRLGEVGGPPGRDPEALRGARQAEEEVAGSFWSSRTGKIVLVTGGVFAAALLVSAADDDDDDDGQSPVDAP